jgi:Histidine kinase-, DNA gyrase B-, and HSP90-like ATPase
MELADRLLDIGQEKGKLQVRLSNQIIHLLSEQMYSSPLKAIEELVVNAYDADASECRIGIPTESGPDRSIVVFDDGNGMDFAGLEQLWHVGESAKREQDVSEKRHRKLIGKFGIGKLATYAIADRITYLSRQNGRILHVTCDYRSFKSDPEGAADAVPLQVNEVDDPKIFRSESLFRNVCQIVGLDADHLTNGVSTWTLCVLESLKPKAAELKIGRLKWVLRTAMPLRTDFAVRVNDDELVSSKANLTKVVSFQVKDLAANRISSLNAQQEDPDWHWSRSNIGLTSSKFPAGVSGSVIVTDRSLVQGKSADIDRSHGFFVKVRGRLVNQKDELFGLHALTHATINYFRADVEADDLNSEVTAPREGLEAGPKTAVLQRLLLELFNEARSRQVAAEKASLEAERRKRENDRTYVPPRLVEQPIADTLSMFGGNEEGPDADNTYFFMTPQNPETLNEIVEQLYTERKKFKFEYVALGRTDRLVKFDPATATFSLNDDHELVTAYADDPRAAALLEDIATSEVMLEVYMREAGIDTFRIGEVLERRDLLLRSLSQDRVYSLDSIARQLRDSVNDEFNLEIALVAAARALGFNAKHVSKRGEPDGLARFMDYKLGESKITLEAKSSEGEPSLGSFDFAGLSEHVKRHGADGCLLIAPSYVGEKIKRKDGGGESIDSAVEHRAVHNKISCWTIEDMARVVEAAESHQITASQVIDIVRQSFKPSDVHAAVEQLLNRTNMQETYREIISALRTLGQPNRLRGTTRTVQHVAAVLAMNSSQLNDDDVRSALVDMSNASRGMLRLNEDSIILNGDLDELERRVASLTGDPGQPRKLGTFREPSE